MARAEEECGSLDVFTCYSQSHVEDFPFIVVFLHSVSLFGVFVDVLPLELIRSYLGLDLCVGHN